MSIVSPQVISTAVAFYNKFQVVIIYLTGLLQKTTSAVLGVALASARILYSFRISLS